MPVKENGFLCHCTVDRTGTRCEIRRDHCHDVTCMNKGVCQPLSAGYACQCLSDSYSGPHCEHISSDLTLRWYVSRTLAYIAITAMVIVATFVVTMDVLKYGFGIDPVQSERDLIRRGRALLERKHRKRRRIERFCCC